MGNYGVHSIERLIDSTERLSKARPGEGAIGDWATSEIRLKIYFQKVFRSTQLQKI